MELALTCGEGGKGNMKEYKAGTFSVAVLGILSSVGSWSLDNTILVDNLHEY